MTTGITMGNVTGTYLIRANLTPAATAAFTAAEQSFTSASTGNNGSLAQLRINDFVCVSPASTTGITTGVAVVGARVTANGTIAITFNNTTGGSLTAPAGAYLIKIDRPESQSAATVISD